MTPARVRRYDAHFADVNASSRMRPSNDPPPLKTSELYQATRAATGAAYWYWSCPCGACGVHDDEAEGREAFCADKRQPIPVVRDGQSDPWLDVLRAEGLL